MTKQHEGWHAFLKLCLAAKDEKTLSELFDFLLTPEERESMITRCLIVKALLDQQLTQRDIAKSLHVSIAKITRGSNELKRISSKLYRFLENKLTS
jgi:TrpR family transcriptional regulator, trp operon repressor